LAPNLVIINQMQFGYHIDTYYYCKYLRNFFDITYICWDQSLPRIRRQHIEVVYVSRKGIILKRSLRFIKIVLKKIRAISRNNVIIFLYYFKVVSLILKIIKLKHTFVLDIRTGNIDPRKLTRVFFDALMKFETIFFKNITVASESLAQKLKLNHKAHILPLGADIISSTDKTFDKLHLLYVGTLFNRNIDVTIHGFNKFYKEFKNQISLSYTIIGTGPNNKEQALRELAGQYGLADIVNVAGMIPHTQLKTWFDTANVGVSYVPVTDYYDCQPVTKTFEYLLSGLPVIATNTSENQKVIKPGNGVIVGDTAEDFYSGLKAIIEKQHLFDSSIIRNEAIGSTWENIVQKNLKVYLEQISR